MTKYFVPAVIVAALFVLAACSIPGIGKNTGGSGQDLGKLKAYHYTRSGGMMGESYDIHITADEEGSIWLYETKSEIVHLRAEPTTYRYRLANDALEKLEAHLKENKLWVKTPYPSSSEIVMDGYNRAWSFETDIKTYPIYSGMTLTDEVRDKLDTLSQFVGEMRSGAKREKDPASQIIEASDILGFTVFKDEQEATVFVHPRGRITLGMESREVDGTTPEALLDEIKTLYLEQKGAWGEQILDCYPMEFETEAGDKNAGDKYAIYLIIKKIDPAYDVVRKFSGDTLPKEVETFIDGTIHLIEQNTKEPTQ